MKPGDKVWYYDHDRQEIVTATVRSYEGIFEDGDFVCVQFDNGTTTIGLKDGVNIFPTREALCEHYRKIFGGIDRKVALLDGIDALKKDAKERHEDDCYLHGLYDVIDMINEKLG